MMNGNIICPKCEGIKFLDKEPTIALLEQNMIEIDQQIIAHLKKRVSKSKMLLELAWQRELFSRNFFSKYQTLNLPGFASYSLLIIRIMREPNFISETSVSYSSEVLDLIKAYQFYIQSKSKFLLLREGFAEPIKKGDKTEVVPNEKYFPILNTYEDNDIMEQSKAEEKQKEYQLIYESFIQTHQLKPVSYTPEQFINQIYSLINQLYSGLLRNEVYGEVFGLLKKYSDIGLTPGKLMDFVNSFQPNTDKLTHVSVHDFIIKASKHLSITERQAKEYLMFYDFNSGIFPLFVMVNGRVYISHRTSFLLYVLLNAILYKNLFDKETEKRSRDFEKDQVRAEFEQIGWKYFPDITDKKQASIQIDGVAFLEKRLLVVECKGWQLYPFYEYQSKQSYFERDIKGIVDGQKFTGGQPTTIPSLLEKVEFVKSNLAKLGFDPTLVNSVQGLIVMRSFPPITEYKGVMVLSIKDIPKVFAKK
jgi:hypothetical protein